MAANPWEVVHEEPVSQQPAPGFGLQPPKPASLDTNAWQPVKEEPATAEDYARIRQSGVLDIQGIGLPASAANAPHEKPSQASPVIGALETAAHEVSGFIANTLGAYGHAVNTFGQQTRQAVAQGTPEVVKQQVPAPKAAVGQQDIDKIVSALTYEPKTARGKAYTQTVELPFKKWQQLAQQAGQQVAAKTGSQVAGEATTAALANAPYIILPELGIRYLKGFKAAPAAEEPISLGDEFYANPAARPQLANHVGEAGERPHMDNPTGAPGGGRRQQQSRSGFEPGPAEPTVESGPPEALPPPPGAKPAKTPARPPVGVAPAQSAQQPSQPDTVLQSAAQLQWADSLKPGDKVSVSVLPKAGNFTVTDVRKDTVWAVTDDGQRRQIGKGLLRPPEGAPQALAKPAEAMPESPDLGASANTPPPAAEKPLDIPQDNTLPQKQKAIETRFRKQIAADPQAAISEYEHRFGRVVNTDNARELSPDYSASKESRSRLSDAVHEPASWLAKRVYQKLLAEPVTPDDDTVFFTAGGTGAGKSSALRDFGVDFGDNIVYDGNLNSFDSARQKIDQALASGRDVEIDYVHRDPVDALVNGALPRAMRMGRAVPIKAHIDTHVGAAKTIRRLAEHYKNDPRVTIRIIDNRHGKHRARAGDLSAIDETNYTDIKDRLQKALRHEYEQGRINQAVYEGTAGGDGYRPGGKLSAPESRGAEQAHSKGAEQPSAQLHDLESQPQRGPRSGGQLAPFPEVNPPTEPPIPAGRANQERRPRTTAKRTPDQQRAETFLGATVGDVVTPSGDIGYSKSGNRYRITNIGKDGSVAVENAETGSGTTWSRAEQMGAERRGVTFGKEGKPETKPQFDLTTRRDGTLHATGDKEAIRAAVKAAGIDAKGIPSRTGILFGKSQAERVRAALEGSAEQESEAAVFSRKRPAPIAFKGDEIKASTKKELALKALMLARQKFAGETVRNKADGSEIIIPWQGIKHSLRPNKSERTLIAASKLDDLIANGKPVRQEADKKGRPTLRAVHIYETPVTFDGEPATVRIIVREARDGRRYYDHYEIEKENGSAGLPGKPVKQVSAQPFTEPPSGSPDKKSIAKRKPDGGEPPALKRGTSQDTRPSAGFFVPPAEQIRAHAAKLMRDWKNRPPVEVVRAESELPKPIRDQIERANAHGEIKGVYWRGKVYLVADNLAGLKEAETAIFHEVLGHYGLRELLGDDLDPVLERVWLAYGRKGLSDIIDRYYPDGSFDANNRNHRRTVAEEQLAHMAQTGEKPSILERLYAAIRRWLRRMGFKIMPGNSEIRSVLAKAREYVESGKGPEGKFLERSGLKEGSPKEPAGTEEAAMFMRGKRHDDATEAALEKAGLGRRHPLQNVLDALKGLDRETREQIRAAMVQGGLDRFHGLKRAELRVAGALPAEQSAYVAARFAPNSRNVMAAVLTHGAPEWRDGVVSVKAGSKGLLDALAPVKGELREWLGWMVGRRAARLKEEGRENLFSEDDINALKELGKGKQAKFVKVAHEYNQVKKAILDFAEEAGLIDATTRPAWDRGDYIPFYRLGEGDGTKGPNPVGGLSGQTAGIRILKGGKEQLNDPLENIVLNFTHLIDAAMKNHAIRRAADVLEPHGLMKKVGAQLKPELIPMSEVRRVLKEQGVDTSMIDPEALQGIQKMMSFKPPTDPDVVRVMREGRPVYYRVNDPLLLRSLTAVNDSAIGGVMRPFRFFSRVLTGSVTTTPDFQLRNFTRDALDAWVNSEGRFIPVWGGLKGWYGSYREDKDFVDMMFAGGSFAGGYVGTSDPKRAARLMRRALRAKGFSAKRQDAFMATVVDTPARFWDMYRRITESAENANREAVYKAMLKQGESRARAALEARDTLDFSMHGDWVAVQVLRDMIPFLNARVQGLYKMARAGTIPGRRLTARAALRGGLIVFGSLALWWKNKDDPRYRQLQWWDKALFWHFFVGDHHFRIPKPFEVGFIYGTVPEIWANHIYHETPDREALGHFMWGVTQALSFNPIPQMILPPIEVISNYSFFTGRPIEGEADLQRRPAERYGPHTSETMKALGRVVSNPLNMSPKKLQHLVRGYTGSLGMYLLSMADLVTRHVEGAPAEPAWRVDQIPVLKSFVRGGKTPPFTQWTEDLYRLRDLADQTYSSIRKLHKEGGKADIAQADKYIRDNQRLLQARPALDHAAHQLVELRHQEQRVINDGVLSPDEKRKRLDKLFAQRAQLSRTIVEDVQQALREK